MDSNLEKFIFDTLIETVNNTKMRMEKEDTHRPFHSALLSDEVIKNSRFERSFSTSFGQKAIELISAEVLKYNGATDVSTQRETNCRIPVIQERAIASHLNDLRNKKKTFAVPNWSKDVQHILTFGNADPSTEYTEIRVISDLYWFKDGKHNYASIKTVKPNIDQTEKAKADLLTLKANDPECNVYFCLYYNPYGESRSSYDHNPPKNIFNFKEDYSVLIGKEYWDTLGGTGFYEELLDVFKKAGKYLNI